MQAQITICCSSAHHRWLIGLLSKAYDDLVVKVQNYAREHETGLPWEWERETDPLTGEVVRFSPELQEGFEVDFSLDYRQDPAGRGPGGVLVSGATFSLRDFWQDENPPPPPPEERRQ